MGEKNWMKKVVFFKDEKNLSDALNNFNIEDFSGENVPIKLHMGERKNKYFPRPEFIKKVVKELINKNIKPYLFDTTVAYSGLRHSKEGYHKLAKLNGFSKNNIGCDIIIDDTGFFVNVENRDFEVADHLYNSSFIFAFSHVKGHIATGMGGAIKNFGMGGVTKETKKQMHHGSRPIFDEEKCNLCGKCAELCPFNAIIIDGNCWSHNMSSCFGCGVCVDSCSTGSLTNKDANLQYLISCAAYACLKDKSVIYLNDVNRIARSCDCDPDAGPIICPDIGYLISDDPVAIDKASLDIIYEIKDNLFENENHINPIKQIEYAEKIGLGSSSYKLIKL
jgi:uncharacterized Fe-S center protein